MAAPQTKAASPYENYGCQCDRYTWVDTYGKIQGNCKSSDSTRGRWCYVQPGNTCGDIQYSKNRRDSYGRLRQWSYEACATPAPGYAVAMAVETLGMEVAVVEVTSQSTTTTGPSTIITGPTTTTT